MCDTMCALQSDRTLFAKNSDRPLAELQLIEAHPRRATGGRVRTTYLELGDPGAHAVLGARPDWMWGFEHGVNEWAVAIGNEEIWSIDDPKAQPPALIGMDLIRLGLERARTADEALDVMTDLLVEHGQGGIANAADDEAYFSSFLIADPRSAWVLETSARSWVARPVHGGASISNRLTIRTDWTRASDDIGAPGTDFDRWRHPTMWTGHADVRMAATRAVAVERSATVGPADLVATLRDHGTGPWARPDADPADAVEPLPGPGFDPDSGDGASVCFHIRGWQATTSSIVAELRADADLPIRAWVAPASPCSSVFVPVFAPADVPVPLADPAVIARFAAVARSVEVGGTDTLATVRSVLGPLERELWEEADLLAKSGRAADPDERSRFAASCWPRLDAALHQLSA